MLAEIWATPTPIDIDFFDKGDEIVVTTARRDNVVGWWLDIFTALYPNQTYREKNELVKIKPAPGVTVKLSRKTGLMKISGKNHWGWMVANFTEVLETANNESEELDDGASLMSDNSVTRYLQLDKNVEMVGINWFTHYSWYLSSCGMRIPSPDHLNISLFDLSFCAFFN